jgi:hypothetical protein
MDSSRIYSKKHMLKALKEADKKHKNIKVPYSYKSLIVLEKKGVIPESFSDFDLAGGQPWRLYTKEEIENNVQKVIQYKRRDGK